MGKLNMLVEKRKQIQFEADEFIKDKSNSFKDRKEVFNEFGAHENWIFDFKNKSLGEIFEHIQDYNEFQKYETINILCELESFIENISEYRFLKNSGYSRSYKLVRRNYTPSKEAITRYENYLIEKVFEEGYKSYEMDW